MIITWNQNSAGIFFTQKWTVTMYTCGPYFDWQYKDRPLVAPPPSPPRIDPPAGARTFPQCARTLRQLSYVVRWSPLDYRVANIKEDEELISKVVLFPCFRVFTYIEPWKQSQQGTINTYLAVLQCINSSTGRIWRNWFDWPAIVYTVVDR